MLGAVFPTPDEADWVAIGIVGLILYFVPFFVALIHKTLDVGWVFVINLFLGWTFIGWIIAFAMAAGSSQSAPAPIRAAVPTRSGPRLHRLPRAR